MRPRDSVCSTPGTAPGGEGRPDLVNGLWGVALVDQWSTPLMDDGELFGNLGLGKTPDVTHVSRDFREHAVLNELAGQRRRLVDTSQQVDSARRIQASVRGWLARRRFLRHKAQLRDLLNQLKVARETEAVTAAQKMVRGFLAKWELRKAQEEDDRRREEADARKKKKKPAPKKKAGGTGGKPLSEMTRAERICAREQPFLDGWDAFAAGVDNSNFRTVLPDGGIRKIEEAIKLWDKAVKAAPGDMVTRRMHERVLKIREQEKQRDQHARDAERKERAGSPRDKK
eukprot:TRINITY_DN66767_c0_g1_i1.p1 TRINITY_DN66767_c0_g1~~TRINITY_DN66767_c0_g1_i1.p1  ORF type:complete len:315 (+),score=111.67 TRINITY_DN66767_c0_g1_i1:92-946(+)